MRDILELCASAMRRPWFYLGSGCLAVNAIVNFVSPPATREEGINWLNLALTFCLGVAYIVFALFQIRELRDEHVVKIPNKNAWNIGLSLAWFHVKVGFLALLLVALPITVFAPAFKAISSGEIRGFGVPLLGASVYLIFAMAVFALMYVSGSALVIARGHAGRSVRDALHSLRFIWVETLFVLLFTVAVGFASSAGVIVGRAIPAMQAIGTGIEVALAPIVYLTRSVAFVYLAKLLRVRASEFVRQRPLDEPAGDQSSSSEA